MRAEAFHGVEAVMVPTQPLSPEAAGPQPPEDDPATAAAWAEALGDPNYTWVATGNSEGGEQ